MSGINYDLSEIRAVVLDVDGVLSPSTISMDSEGMPVRMMNVKDGYALQYACRHGLTICIISGGTGEPLERRYSELGIKDIFLGVAEKWNVLEKWMSSRGLSQERIAYVGDDIPDMECLQRCGLPCCPADASTDVKKICTYISQKDGGYGCVRDIIEQILRAQGKWMATRDAFGW